MQFRLCTVAPVASTSATVVASASAGAAPSASRDSTARKYRSLSVSPSRCCRSCGAISSSSASGGEIDPLCAKATPWPVNGCVFDERTDRPRVAQRRCVNADSAAWPAARRARSRLTSAESASLRTSTPSGPVHACPQPSPCWAASARNAPRSAPSTWSSVTGTVDTVPSSRHMGTAPFETVYR